MTIDSLINFGTCCFTGGLLGVAIYALNGWQKELRAKRSVELAEEVMTLLSQVKNAFRIIRKDGYHNGPEEIIKAYKLAPCFDRLFDLSFSYTVVFNQDQDPFHKVFEQKNRLLDYAGYLKTRSGSNPGQLLIWDAVVHQRIDDDKFEHEFNDARKKIALVCEPIIKQFYGYKK